MKNIILFTIALCLFISCNSQTIHKPITNPKIGEWVWFEGNQYAKPCARRISTSDSVVSHSYLCSIEIVKEDRQSYKRYATREEIEKFKPLEIKYNIDSLIRVTNQSIKKSEDEFR